MKAVMVTRRISQIGSQAGFTLLELMLAIAIGGMVLTAVYNLFSVGVDTQRRIARVASQTQAWRFYAERLRTDLRNLLVEAQTLSGDRNSLTLRLASAQTIRYEWRVTAHSGQVRRLVLSEGDETDAETVVYEGSEKLAFRYLNDGKWLNQSEEGVPRAVECTLHGGAGEQRLVVALEVESAGE
ncbi:MAG: prepilin-type N-terminal cleavage/methylation domain-containing protein [bacterium]|nr:prepilin-type N-terminal cleavage/methylation domain-containing protein [bacterium]